MEKLTIGVEETPKKCEDKDLIDFIYEFFMAMNSEQRQFCIDYAISFQELLNEQEK